MNVVEKNKSSFGSSDPYQPAVRDLQWLAWVLGNNRERGAQMAVIHATPIR